MLKLSLSKSLRHLLVGARAYTIAFCWKSWPQKIESSNPGPPDSGGPDWYFQFTPPPTDSLATQVGFAGPCGQVGHTGQNQMCCICCSRCPCNLPFRQLCNPGSYLQGTVSPLLIPEQLWWKFGPQELSSSNLSQADSGRLKWCLTIPLLNTS